MATQAGPEAPRLESSDDYRKFMRSQEGRKIVPRSEEERVLLKGFKAALGNESATAESARSGRVKTELRERAGLGADTSYVRPEVSQDIHRLEGEDTGEITVTKTGEGGDEVPDPVPAIEGPTRQIPIEQPDGGPQEVPVHIVGAKPAS